MNSDYQDFLSGKRMTKLWSPYPELVKVAQAATLAVLETIDEERTLSVSTLRFFSQEVVSNALELTPLHQIEKISHRIQETMHAMIPWAESRYPDLDFFDARLSTNFFAEMGEYARKAVANGELEKAFERADMMIQQKVGSSYHESTFLGHVLSHITKQSDVTLLDEYFHRLGSLQKPVFEVPPSIGQNIDVSLMVHAIRQVGDRLYSLRHADVCIAILSLFRGCEAERSYDIEKPIKLIIQVLDELVPTDAEKIKLLSNYNAAGGEAEALNPQALEAARVFHPTRLFGRSLSEEIKATMGGYRNRSWRHEAALTWCRSFPAESINLEHLVLLSLGESPDVINERRLSSDFTRIFEGLDSLSQKYPDDNLYTRNWESSTLRYEGTTGELLLRALKRFVTTNIENRVETVTPKTGKRSSFSIGQNTISNHVLKTAERKPDISADIMYLWAMITACGVQQQARDFLADFYAPDYRSIAFWTEHTGDNPQAYLKHEWYSESLLQSDLGL